eukprot:10204706-Heterocapsa_arctica.AAC.1
MTALRWASVPNSFNTPIASQSSPTRASVTPLQCSAPSAAATQTSLTCYMRPLVEWPGVVVAYFWRL